MESIAYDTVNLVCSGHFSDPGIKAFIKHEGIIVKCHYCKKKRRSIDLERLAKFLMDTVHHYYTDPVNFSPYNSAEGGYLVEHRPAWEILVDDFQLDIDDFGLSLHLEQVLDDGNTYADADMWHDEGMHHLPTSWRSFCSAVKHKTWVIHTIVNNAVKHKIRFSMDLYPEDEFSRSLTPKEMMNAIGEFVSQYGLIKKLTRGTPLVRCRQHIRSLEVRLAKDLCSPPDECCTEPNRMSPAGVSMFYGAFDRKTAKVETVRKSDEETMLTTSHWVLNESIWIVDLSALPRLPSAFDPERRDDYIRLRFLTGFLTDFTKPVNRGKESFVNYIPTQIVTEYFRFGMGDNIRGVIYPSSRNMGKKVVVLFLDHHESLQKLTFKQARLTHEPVPPSG